MPFDDSGTVAVQMNLQRENIFSILSILMCTERLG